MTLPRPSWVRLNRLYVLALLNNAQIVIGFLGELLLRSRGGNGRPHTTVASCSLYHLPKGTLSLVALEDDTVDWLQTTALSI